MNTTTKDTDTIRCGTCGQLGTYAEARACARLDAETPDDAPQPDERHLGEGHPHDTW